MPFHAVIDVRRWGDFGIGTYVRNLVGALARIDHDNRYTLIIRPQDAATASGLPSNFQVAPYARPDTEVLHNVTFPYFLRRFRADLYHIPLNSVAYWMPRPYVVTIHDMSSVMFPYGGDLRSTLHEERSAVALSERRASLPYLIQPDRSLEATLKISPGRIRTIYSVPPDPAFTHDHERRAGGTGTKLYDIRRPFILYAGTIRPQNISPGWWKHSPCSAANLNTNPDYRDLRLVIIGDVITLSGYCVRRAFTATRVDTFFPRFVPLETLKVFYRAASSFARSHRSTKASVWRLSKRWLAVLPWLLPIFLR